MKLQTQVEGIVTKLLGEYRGTGGTLEPGCADAPFHRRAGTFDMTTHPAPTAVTFSNPVVPGLGSSLRSGMETSFRLGPDTLKPDLKL